MRKPTFYLAAPFFNAAQISLVEQIEQAFAASGVDLISPRLQVSNKGVLTSDKAEIIFQRNMEDLSCCRYVLAVVDWKMPPEESVSAFRRTKGRTTTGEASFSVEPVGLPLNLPDSGTVFEMGAARAMCKDIIIYTDRSEREKLNVMLAKASRGVVRDIGQLCRFLNNGIFNWSEAPEYTGTLQ